MKRHSILISTRKAILFSIIFLISACTTPQQRAEKLMQNEAFEEAALVYEQIIAKNPKDAEAAVGLRRAREKTIDTKLIQVRMSRLGGNDQNAADMLLKIILNENQWQLYPSGKAQYTQEEEKDFSLGYLTRKIEKANSDQFPLLSLFILKKFAPIFDGAQSKRMSVLQAKTKSRGLDICKKLVALRRRELPYFSLWVKDFCGTFSNDSTEAASFQVEQLKGLFSQVSLKGNIEGLSQSDYAGLQQALLEGLKTSVWYDPKGANRAEVRLDGSFSNDHTTQSIQQFHSYTIQEPYTDYELQTRSREVPYTDTEARIDPYSGRLEHQSVTKYRSEFYQESIPVTAYRNVPMSQPYGAIQHRQVLLLALSGEVNFGENHWILSFNERSDQSGIEHHVSMPDIGLFPKSLNLPNPTTWLKGQTQNVKSAFEKKSSELWDSLYCRPSDGSSIAASGEQVLKCGRNRSKQPPEFVLKWYQDNLGVTPEQANEVMKL